MIYPRFPTTNMVKISCNHYGFDCDFEINGNSSEVIEKYQKHSINEHGIEYSTEGLNQLLLRMKN